MNARMDLQTMLKDDTHALDKHLAKRIESAALNATDEPEQQNYDGWLLRFSAESSKRMRSVHVIGSSNETQDLDVHLSYCKQQYEQKALPMAIRLTDLDDDQDLDHELAARGYVRSDETLVMARRLDTPLDSTLTTPNGTPCVTLDKEEFSETLGRLKRSEENDVKAHARRLKALTADVLPRCIKRTGDPIATGLAVLENDLVGVFDVAVASSHRRKGWGGLLVCQLMADAAGRGARYAYLQVDATNQIACRLWRRLGFQNLYTYWYRGAPSVLADSTRG